MYKKTLILIFVLLLIIPFVSSAPPITQTFTGDVGLTLENPLVTFIKQGRDVNPHIHVFNSSNGYPMDNSTVSCFLDIYNQTGSEILTKFYDYVHESEWEMTILGENFSTTGEYGFLIQCNTSEVGGFIRGKVQVTASGTEESTTAIALFYLGSMVIILLFLSLSVYGIVNASSMLGKYVFVVLTYLFSIALTFISFVMADTFIKTSSFLVWFLKLLFMILMWSFLPFFLLSMVFILYMMYKDKEVEKLIEKGIPEAEARKRIFKK